MTTFKLGMEIILIVTAIKLIHFGYVKIFHKEKPSKPESLRYWGVLYFGERGCGKTLHQSWEIIKVIQYWSYIWKKYPHIRHGIILSNQILSEAAMKEIGKYTIEKVFYHFDDGEDMQFCPRINCWRGKDKHMLHGALIVLDDIATFLPSDGWQSTPLWMRKQWTQAQHLGLHFLFNCQVPTSYDIHARQATAIAFKFHKIIGSARPDETALPIRYIWGWYRRYKIKAYWLWQYGNMEPEQIADLKEGLKEIEEITVKPSAFSGIYNYSIHWISRKKSERYDTLQDVKEYEPQGYIGKKEYDCIDETHNHTEKGLDNYKAFKKADHILV
jgi:hypothetical protein